jgi:mxaA protein
MKIYFVLLLRLPLLYLSLLNLPAFAANDSANPEKIIPVKVTIRDNGYTLGDSIAMHAEFNLAKGLVFDPNSVPLKGPVNNWLDLRDVTMIESKNSDDNSHISIDFTWQIFGTVEHAQTLKIPAIQLQTIPPNESEKAGDNNKPIAITIPAQGFHLSPVLPPSVTENKHRPHAPPLRFDTRTPLIIGLLCLGLSLLCGILWLWLMDKIVWWPRNPGPITQLSRQLSKAGVAQQPNFSFADLRSIHKALASSAGQSLYPNTVDNLFERAPYLSADKPTITQFFNVSWQSFFASSTSSTVSVAETLAWIKRSAMAERIFRAYQAKKPAKVKTIAVKQAVKA